MHPRARSVDPAYKPLQALLGMPGQMQADILAAASMQSCLVDQVHLTQATRAQAQNSKELESASISASLRELSSGAGGHILECPAKEEHPMQAWQKNDDCGNIISGLPARAVSSVCCPLVQS